MGASTWQYSKQIVKHRPTVSTQSDQHPSEPLTEYLDSTECLQQLNSECNSESADHYTSQLSAARSLIVFGYYTMYKIDFRIWN